ncbi:MAG TPA: hypothetical protein VKQ32_26145 [Polyangia bacterium]|nr:hypothetical protein [Polyangia bacterium]
MVRLAILTVAIAACAATKPSTIAPSSGSADEPFAVWPPRMPSAIDLDKVPLGKWAEYEETYLGSVTIKERVALVGRGADGATIETTTVMPSGDKTVFANVFVPRSGGGGMEIARSVFQVSDADPMESPPVPPSQQPYPRVDPGKLVGIDTIKVRAGTFRAKHYRDRTAYGEQVDFWIDDSVGPIGLIQLQAEQKQHPAIRAGFTFQLVAAGSDAIQQITKAPLPFDPSLLKKRGLPWTREARVGPQPPAKVVR